MDQHAVIVFRDQTFTDAEHLAYAERFDGNLHRKTGASVIGYILLGDDYGVDLRESLDRQTLEAIRSGMDHHALLVFRDQTITDSEQLAFAERFDGKLHRNYISSAISKRRLCYEALTVISKLDAEGE